MLIIIVPLNFIAAPRKYIVDKQIGVRYSKYRVVDDPYYRSWRGHVVYF